MGGICALTDAECGLYLRLLLHQWSTKDVQAIPSDPERLRLICRGIAPGEPVLAKFIESENGLRNERLASEWAAAKEEYVKKAGGGGDKTLDQVVGQIPVQTPQQTAGHILPASKNQDPRTKIQEPTNGKSSLRSEVESVFTYWQAVMEHPDSRLTNDRRRLIEARLKEGSTVDQIKAAIDGCRASNWHMGDNPGRKLYDGLGLICRSGEKLDEFRHKVPTKASEIQTMPPPPTEEEMEASRRAFAAIKPMLSAAGK